MKNAVVSFIVGFIFAIGLVISGMTQPQKVVGFLNLFNGWDPTLIFVMGGAVTVHFITYRLIRKRKTPILAPSFQVPTKTEITPALVLGATIFGFGWGLAGFCPGPAVTAIASFESRPLIFVISMLIGMLLFKQVDKKLKLQK